MSQSLYESESVNEAITSFNRWRSNAMNLLGEVLEDEPSMPMANIAKGLILVGARHVQFLPVIDSCLDAISAGDSVLAPHETSYLDALQKMRRDDFGGATDVLESLLKERPTDLFAHRLLQQELFWSGDVRRMYGVATRAASHWRGDEPDYGGFLGLLAFGNEETGHYEAAEKFGRESVERDPSDAWGAHAVAHVLEMQGRIDDGIKWLESLNSNWGEVNQLAHHVWWHLCLFYLERKDHEKILHLISTQVYNTESPLVKGMPDLYIDLQNVASLLLRLQMRGVDVGNHWDDVIESSLGRIDNHYSPFTSAHAAIVFGATERFDDGQRLIDSMQDYIDANDNSLTPRLKLAALPAAKASLAYFKGDSEAVVEHLMPARNDLKLMGGSHAQRDIFIQVLYDACNRLGQHDAALTLVKERSGVGYTMPEFASFWH